MAASPTIDLHLDLKQLAAIGYCNAQWSFFETEMNFTLTAMTFMADGSWAIPFPLGDRLARWKSLLGVIFKDTRTIDQYQKIIDAAQIAHQSRTKSAHGRALGDPSKKTRLICVEHHEHRRGKWNVRNYFIHPRKLQAIGFEIGRVTVALIRLNEQHLSVRPKSLPNRYPAPRRGGLVPERLGPTRTIKWKTLHRSLRA